MSVQSQVMEQMKAAMKSKDTVALESLRALKSAFLLANTSGSSVELSEEEANLVLQYLMNNNEGIESAKYLKKQLSRE